MKTDKMKTDKEFFDKWKSMTEFTLEVEEIKLRLLRGIRNNLADSKIQEIIDWKGERITSFFDEKGYCGMCRDVMDKYSGRWDCVSTSATRDMIAFVSNMILLVAEQNIEQQKQIKQDKINKLKKEIEELEQSQSMK